jgi:geranylgeranyl diphosphate synthase type II
MANTFSINSSQANNQMHQLQDLQAIIQKKIDGFCRKNGEQAILQPVNYILQLGGKRIRPLLTLLSAQAFSEDIDDAVYPAIALEVFHNFTLMHDDIMDNAPIRRGKPTVHERWNRDVAILSGDAMLIQAYQLIMKTRPECLAEVLETFNTTALEVCVGQQMDMDFQFRQDVTVDEYIEMIRLKTSVLLGGAMKIGAIIGKASEADREAIYQFAIALGISFQLWDDYLDTFGEEHKIGKQVGGDILANKKTFLMISALESANDIQKKALESQLTNMNPSEKIKSVIGIFRELDLDKRITEKADFYYTNALAQLNSIGIAESKKESLRSLAQALHKREF